MKAVIKRLHLSFVTVSRGVKTPWTVHRTHPRPLLYSNTQLHIVLLTYLLTSLTYSFIYLLAAPRHGTTKYRGKYRGTNSFVVPITKHRQRDSSYWYCCLRFSICYSLEFVYLQFFTSKQPLTSNSTNVHARRCIIATICRYINVSSKKLTARQAKTAQENE